MENDLKIEVKPEEQVFWERVKESAESEAANNKDRLKFHQAVAEMAIKKLENLKK